jgi:CheY-like chemotaxis protein
MKYEARGRLVSPIAVAGPAVVNPALVGSRQIAPDDRERSAPDVIQNVKHVCCSDEVCSIVGDVGTKTISGAYRLSVRRGETMGLVEARRPVVLIVEDEFLLRMDAAEMIGAAGFEVIEAANADQAIEVLEARRDITVVFTDIQMPGSMDGLKLARAVRGRWPPIKIIATSGRLHFSETDLPEGGRFLPKPYSPAQVTGVLRELTIGN